MDRTRDDRRGAGTSAPRDTSSSKPGGAIETASYHTHAPGLAATQAIRGSYCSFGAPIAGTWFGHKATQAAAGTVVTLKRIGRTVYVRDTDGDLVASFGVNGKFWLVPAGGTGPALTASRTALIKLCNGDNNVRRVASTEDADTAACVAAGWLYQAPGRGWYATTPAGAGAAGVEHNAQQWQMRTGSEIVPAPAQDLEPVAAASRPVVIVPCGIRKFPGLVRAAEKYCGPYARSARLAGEAVAELTGATVVTLSALYGLLEDDDLVDDYNLRMGDPGSVTAGRVAEQAARLGITNSLVTVIAGKAYADIVSTVWPHAVRALDGCTSYGNQRARMAAIARGTWSPPAGAGATAAPALFGAELVAPADVTLAAAGDLVRGDVLAPGTLGAQHADPVLVTASARPVDEPDGRQRVSLIVRPLPYAGHSRHLIVWADTGVDVVGHDRGTGNDWIHPPAEDAEILDGPALTWPRLLTAGELRAGDICAPGALGLPSRSDTITVVTGPVYCDTVAGVRRYDIGTRVNLPSGPGPVRHGALRADSYVTVIERANAIEASASAPHAVPAPIVRGVFAGVVRRALAEHAQSPADTTVALAAPRYETHPGHPREPGTARPRSAPRRAGTHRGPRGRVDVETAAPQGRAPPQRDRPRVTGWGRAPPAES